MFQFALIPILIILGFGYASFADTSSQLSQESPAQQNSAQIQKTIPETKENSSKNYDCSLVKNNPDLLCETKSLNMKTNFGDLKIEMYRNDAPMTTYSFIKLSQKGYFDSLKFHRIVKQPNFSVIQGGDPKGNGSGGQSFFGKSFEDEIYNNQLDQTSKNFKNKSLYTLADPQDLTANPLVIYQKGQIAMANSGPNTNGSQFFIILQDTYLPASYTIFGRVDPANFAVLEKISKEVDVIDTYSQNGKPSQQGDGKPSKDLSVVKLTLN